MSDQHRDVADILVRFTQSLSDEQSVSHVFATLGEYCRELLRVEGIGVLLLEEGALVVATADTPSSAAVERLEVELEEGPCTDAIRGSRRVPAPDLAVEVDRWPRFVPRAIDAGVRGIHGLPIGGRSGLPIGALNVVSTDVRHLSDDDLRIAEMLSDVALSYLVSSRAGEQASELAAQLQRALDSRVVIEQAKGFLAGRHGYGLDAAFERLRAHARSNGRRLHAVARDVCEGDLDLE